MNAPKPGDLLDQRYRIVRTLAKGGFGQTYIAQDTRRTSCPVCVVKHLTPASNDPKFLENARRLFITEAETLEKLGKHERIPRLLADFEENNEFYLVQDFIEGHPLADELQLGQRWTESQICKILREGLTILEFIHSYGVIHRDVKPDNLIRRSSDGKLVLVDFGTVKQIQTQMLHSGQAYATIAVGTPGYMPSEQSRGNPRPNSDIYALGIIGIQAATGMSINQLQEDPTTGELMWQPWAEISQELKRILAKMVLYSYRERYQSATEVLQELELIESTEKKESSKHNITALPSAQQSNKPQPTQVSGDPVIVTRSDPCSRQRNNHHQQNGSELKSIALMSLENEKKLSLGSSTVSSAQRKDAISYVKLFRQAVIVGSGSWILALVLVSVIGAIWSSAAIGLLILAVVTFGLFAKKLNTFERLSLFIISGLCLITLLHVIPQNKGIFQLLQGIEGLFSVGLLTIFAIALAFVFLNLALFLKRN